jgi:ribosomal protein S18 acetylase RimI-like enzyme
VTVGDWRLLPAASAAGLYRREWIRWRRRLAWDTAPAWRTVETARVTWGLPGLVCRDADGHIRGWCFYLLRPGSLDVGGFVADGAAATAALVDALIARARGVGRLTGFVYAHADGLDAALITRGLHARPFRYLVKDLRAPTPESPGSAATRPWAGERPDEAARLLQAAYGPSGRMFAPGNEPHEWLEYTANLISDPACGVFSPALSRVVSQGADYQGLAVVTMLGPRTAHLAQIAIHPTRHRQGLARHLVHEVLSGARAAGCTRLSLLVSGDNRPARALYDSLGFAERELFLAFDSPDPWC